jgi:hypothetical protein
MTTPFTTKTLIIIAVAIGIFLAVMLVLLLTGGS